ncbi:MAG: histidine phosphatase family protein [Rhizobiaceae bacterium]|nr:histidine phosphatase family protein [Rhizobiaceae bacterium]
MIFLRHPTPDVETGMCYGRTDLDIAEIGHGQIERAMELTPRVTRILASPAIRCRQLATRLAERDGLEVQFDERLWEMNMGEFEGMMWADIDRRKSEVWFADPMNHPTPGGESFADVQTRVLKALEAAHMETAIVCHAGVIRATQMAWEGKSFREVFDQMPPYAEPIRITPPSHQEGNAQPQDHTAP